MPHIAKTACGHLRGSGWFTSASVKKCNSTFEKYDGIQESVLISPTSRKYGGLHRSGRCSQKHGIENVVFKKYWG